MKSFTRTNLIIYATRIKYLKVNRFIVNDGVEIVYSFLRVIFANKSPRYESHNHRWRSILNLYIHSLFLGIVECPDKIIFVKQTFSMSFNGFYEFKIRPVLISNKFEFRKIVKFLKGF